MPRWKPFEPYFWSLVAKSDGCWEWQGNLSKGYGRVHFSGRREAAHRVAWILTRGAIPNGLFCCHHCDNRKCVRPDHIFLGTQEDNMQDWTKKGRNKALNRGDFRHFGDTNNSRNPEVRARISRQRKQEFAAGKRKILRGEGGRIVGTCRS